MASQEWKLRLGWTGVSTEDCSKDEAPEDEWPPGLSSRPGEGLDTRPWKGIRLRASGTMGGNQELQITQQAD